MHSWEAYCCHLWNVLNNPFFRLESSGCPQAQWAHQELAAYLGAGHQFVKLIESIE